MGKDDVVGQGIERIQRGSLTSQGLGVDQKLLTV